MSDRNRCSSFSSSTTSSLAKCHASENNKVLTVPSTSLNSFSLSPICFAIGVNCSCNSLLRLDWRLFSQRLSSVDPNVNVILTTCLTVFVDCYRSEFFLGTVLSSFLAVILMCCSSSWIIGLFSGFFVSLEAFLAPVNLSQRKKRKLDDDSPDVAADGTAPSPMIAKRSSSTISRRNRAASTEESSI